MKALKRTFGFIHSHPLSKNHLIRAYFKLINWQIRSRVYPKLQKVRFIEDTFFYAKKHLTGVTGNIYTGLHEFNEMGFLLHLLRKEDTFFDVGANVGTYTLLASANCEAKTVAFEPIPSTFELLQKNIHLNNLENLVISENKGIGENPGILSFSINQDTTNHVISIPEYGEETLSVQVESLDHYINGKNIPVLMKIDVEGYENEVIKGADNLLENPSFKALIIEISNYGQSMENPEISIHEKLLDYGFQSYNYNPLQRKLTHLKEKRGGNVIYIKDLDFVEKRIKNARTFKVFGQKI